ncbi:MAG: hypothetical protein PHQ43_02755 [Dehalococcoidales bacterium]|nr:hypothetical protein [Dehalococcoidales bacterium]
MALPKTIDDLQRIAQADPRFIVESYFWIENKDKQVVPFVFNQVQDKYYRERTDRDDVLKARQEGLSSLILSLFAVDFLFVPNSRSACISHEAKATERLFNKVKFYIESLSFDERTRPLYEWIDLKYQSKTELYFPKMNSWFYVGTAGAKAFGRGDTIHNLHCSEIAYWSRAEELMTGLLQAVPESGRVIKETTANGIGNYHHREWIKEIEGDSPFTTHFFGWNEHDEYQRQPEPGFTLTIKEQEIQQRYQLTKEQLAWRRAKMSEFSTPELFKQEYPINWEEAFVASGNPVFNVDALMWYRDQTKEPEAQGLIVGVSPPAFEANPGGYLRIWQYPKSEGQYVIGADPSSGGQDPACAQVLDRKTFEQVAVWHGHIDPDNFGRELNYLGHYYNQATIAVERNNEGIATLMVLRDLYYPNLWLRERVGGISDQPTTELGWLTDIKSRPIMVGDGQRAIRDKSIKLHDPETIRELLAFAFDEHGKSQAQEGEHDDRVLALLIAIQMYQRVPLDEDNQPTTRSANELDQSDLTKPGPGVVDDFF